MSNRELKYQTTTYSGSLAATGAVLNITQPIAQGDNVNNRSGNQINVKYIDLLFQCSMNSAAGTDHVRMILVQDKLNLGSNISVTDVLDTAGVDSAYNTYTTQSGRFKILHDEVFPMSINGSNRAISFKRRFPMKDTKVTYTTTTGSYGKNSVFVIVMGDLGANVTTYAVGYGIAFHDA